MEIILTGKTFTVILAGQQWSTPVDRRLVRAMSLKDPKWVLVELWERREFLESPVAGAAAQVLGGAAEAVSKAVLRRMLRRLNDPRMKSAGFSPRQAGLFVREFDLRAQYHDLSGLRATRDAMEAML